MKQCTRVPRIERRLSPDDRDALIQLLREGSIYAKLGEDGQIRFVHSRFGGQEDAVPLDEAIQYLMR
jgi:hypothetical protein